MAAPPALDLTVLATDEHTTIDELRAGGILVLDFWTTRCERCPAALDGLNKRAGETSENAGVVFTSVNCDDAEFAKELLEEGGWENMVHCYVDEANKNIVKEKLGLKSVPFLCIVNKDGMVAYAGPAKDVDLGATLSGLLSAKGPNDDSNNRTLVLDEDF